MLEKVTLMTTTFLICLMGGVFYEKSQKDTTSIV
jgi:hypothetical protein